jgi:FAD:protein FMN transferase
VLQLIACGSALPASAWAALSHSAVTWDGVALGAEASVVVEGFSEIEAQKLIDGALTELTRLERIFSLYDNQSALARLNEKGHLQAAPRELMEALEFSRSLFRQTDGSFDPTVQSYWLGDHLAPVSFEQVSIDNGTIHLAPGTQLTLNGVAQGIITDRIAEYFRSAGANNTLINLGEFRATGRKSNQDVWRVGLRDPAAVWRTSETVALTSGALATSARALPSAKLAQHIFDPATGLSPTHFQSVSVVAPTATLADGLSTALFVMPLESGLDLITRQQKVAAHFMMADGQTYTTLQWEQLTS